MIGRMLDQSRCISLEPVNLLYKSCLFVRGAIPDTIHSLPVDYSGVSLSHGVLLAVLVCSGSFS